MDLNPYATPAATEDVATALIIPQSLPEILMRSVTLYIHEAPAILGLIFAVWTPLQLALGYIEYFVLEPDAERDLYGSSFWIENLVALLPVAGITEIAHASLTGGKPSLWLGLSSAVAAWPRLLGARIVASLVIILSFVAFFVPGIYVGTRSALTDQIAILEVANPMLSMQRSFALTKGYFWRYFLLLAIYLGLGVLAGILTDFVPTFLYPDIEPWLLLALQSLLIYLIFGWVTVALTVAYWASLEEKRLLDSHLLPVGDEPLAFHEVFPIRDAPSTGD